MKTTGEHELVSVVIAVRDCERYLGQAIESVLAQDYEPLELVVVDDGSVDGSAEVARSYEPSLRVVSQPPGGVGSALNRGVSLARGGLLAFLDSDDLWVAGKLALQTAVLREHPEIEVVFGHAEHFAWDDRGTITIAALPAYAKGSMLVRRAAFERVGPFSTELRVADFVDWWARALDLGLASLMLPEVAVLRRVHGDNMGIRLRHERVEYARVLKDVLDRRRAANS
jgi:glycosyltransferase involved in cell wall biosynthesis